MKSRKSRRLIPIPLPCLSRTFSTIQLIEIKFFASFI
jgi:hypothetical protein